MTATDPTPGPWSIDEDQGIIDIKIGPQSDAERFSYARLFLPTWDSSRPDDQDRANARLISLAPELLALAQSLVDADYAMTEHDSEEDLTSIFADARSILRRMEAA